MIDSNQYVWSQLEPKEGPAMPGTSSAEKDMVLLHLPATVIRLLQSPGSNLACRSEASGNGEAVPRPILILRWPARGDSLIAVGVLLPEPSGLCKCVASAGTDARILPFYSSCGLEHDGTEKVDVNCLLQEVHHVVGVGFCFSYPRNSEAFPPSRRWSLLKRVILLPLRHEIYSKLGDCAILSYRKRSV